jgi:hypothetical protein
MDSFLLIIISIVFWGGILFLIIWRNPDFNIIKFIRKRTIVKEKVYDIICFVVGPLITVFSIFSFTGSQTLSLGGSHGAYYSQESKIGIGIGIALICMGFIRRYWRKKESGKSS